MTKVTQASKLRTLLATPTSQLFNLQDIGTTRTWDYTLPTITTLRGFTDRLNFNSDESFFKIFRDVNGGLPYKILKHAGVFEKGNDIVSFGGCLLDIILKRENEIKDFDLRLVGERYMDDEAKCVDKAKQFVSSIFDYLSKENEKIDQRVAAAKEEGRQNTVREVKCRLQEIVVSRARSTVSVHIPSFGNVKACVFQMTFAPAKTVQDLLQGCQPHCTRLAVVNGAVVLDHLARFSIESMAIVLDTSSFVNYYCGEAEDENEQAKRASSGRHIAGQFARFMKYHQHKGFDIILPELNIETVPRRNLEYDVHEVLPLPCMTVVYNEVDNNSIMTIDLRSPKSLAGKTSESGLIGSYDSNPIPNVGDAIHYNIRCLVNEVYDSFKYVAKGERWGHVFDFTPSLTSRMVKKSYETVSEDLQSGSIPIHRLTGYFSVTSPAEVVEKLIVKPLRKKVCRQGSLPKRFDLDEDILKELVEMEISQLIEKIEGLRDAMVRKGCNKLVCQFPEKVSTKEEVFQAIYGDNGVKQKNGD